MVRKLVEEDQVLLIFNPLGTPPNTAIRGYLNDNKVPQLFVATGADKWNDPKNFPWTMGYQPSYRIEARIYGRYILKELPNAKIAVLYQNDDFGKDYLIGLREGLGDKADKMIVATKTYETTDPTVDSQIVVAAGKRRRRFGDRGDPQVRRAGDPQGLRHRLEADAHRQQRVELGRRGDETRRDRKRPSASSPRPTARIRPIRSGRTRPTCKEWLAWMKKYYPAGNITDANNTYGYGVAYLMVAVLKACGDNLTRENVMKEAANLHIQGGPLSLPGITISTSATDYAPIKQMQMMKFDGNTWNLFGEVISGSGT